MAAWTVGGLPSASKSFAEPISKFQSDVLRQLAAQRSPHSYIAGGIAINRRGPRLLDKYQRDPGGPSGLWPSSPDITRAMLERYGKPKAQAAVHRSGSMQT
jgi:hypothetical protein